MGQKYEQLHLFNLAPSFRVRVVVERKDDTTFFQEVSVSSNDQEPLDAVKRYAKTLGKDYHIVDWWAF